MNPASDMPFSRIVRTTSRGSKVGPDVYWHGSIGIWGAFREASPRKKKGCASFL